MGWEALIISLLQPMLLKCLENFSAEEPQDYLKGCCDVYGNLYPDVVQDAMPQTRRAVRRAWLSNKEDRPTEPFPRLSRHELYRLTEQTLLNAMNATPEELQAIRGAAENLDIA
jgi:hypothetical protein